MGTVNIQNVDHTQVAVEILDDQGNPYNPPAQSTDWVETVAAVFEEEPSISAGRLAHRPLDYACTLESIRVYSEDTGDIDFDLKKNGTGFHNFAVFGSNDYSSTDAAGQQFADGDVLTFQVNSSNHTNVTLSARMARSEIPS
jgi:hypothetical protein